MEMNHTGSNQDVFWPTILICKRLDEELILVAPCRSCKTFEPFSNDVNKFYSINRMIYKLRFSKLNLTLSTFQTFNIKKQY